MYTAIPHAQDLKMDKRMTMAVETLLSLRGGGAEWRPPSPASSVNSDTNGPSPQCVAREEEVACCTDGGELERADEASEEARREPEGSAQLPHLPNVVSLAVFAQCRTHASPVFVDAICLRTVHIARVDLSGCAVHAA